MSEQKRPRLERLFGTSERIYTVMTVATLGFGAAAFIIGIANFWGQLLNSVAQSFLVALILALLVDPYLKVTGFKESAASISEGNFWETVSPNCPPEYRQRIKELAAWSTYSYRSFINVRFSWVDDDHTILRLEIVISLEMKNTLTDSYRPARGLWLLASTPGYESSYRQWLMKIPSIEFNEVVEQDGLMPHATIRDDGAIVIDEDALARTFTDPPAIVPPGADFESRVQGVMYRRNRGYLPLSHRCPVANGKLRCTGPALQDLVIDCRFAGINLTPRNAVNEPVIIFTQPELATPGQSYLLSWKLREDLTSKQP